MKKIMKIKNKKGFTLIEIIIVLVIIAILAAVSVPSLLGYVEEARGKAYINEARAGMTAAQVVLTEAIASGKVASVSGTGDFAGGEGEFSDADNILETTRFAALVADVELNGGNVVDTFTDVTVESNRVTGIVYNNGMYVITIASGGTTVEKVGAGGGGGTETSS